MAGLLTRPSVRFTVATSPSGVSRPYGHQESKSNRTLPPHWECSIASLIWDGLYVVVIGRVNLPAATTFVASVSAARIFGRYLLDQTPGEMIIALRRGEIDLALTGHGVDLLSRDFYTHKLASVPSLVALPLDHPLASEKQIFISQLKNESFVGPPDSVVPGFKQKIVELCRRFGKFRPRFVSLEQPVSLAEELAMANEGAISMHPIFISHLGIPNVVMVPIADKQATWDLFVVWQRGKASGPLRALLDALTGKAGR